MNAKQLLEDQKRKIVQMSSFKNLQSYFSDFFYPLRIRKLSKLLLAFSLSILFLGNAKVVAQQTISFSYGDQHEYLGSVRISMILTGERIDKGVSQVLFLNRKNAQINLNKITNPKIILKVQNLSFSNFEHNSNYYLSLPINSRFLTINPAGLQLENAPKNLAISPRGQSQKANDGEIIFTPLTNLSDLVYGEIKVAFEIIDGNGNAYVVNPNLSFNYNIIPEGLEVEPVVVENTTKPRKKVQAALPPTTIEGEYVEEEDPNVKAVNYTTSTKNNDLDKKHDTSFENPSFNSSSSPLISNAGFYAEMDFIGAYVEIQNIQNGHPVYALAFYTSEDFLQKVYTLKLGSASSFKINLNKLPLKAGEYFVELIDKENQRFQLPNSIVVKGVWRAGIRSWPWEWIGVIAGVLILFGTLITLYVQKFA